MVEQRTENPCVVSSILTRGTQDKKIDPCYIIIGGFIFLHNNRGVWPSWSKASGLGPEDREFKSLHPDNSFKLWKMKTSKSKHPNHVVGWPGTLDELIQAIGNMSYDQVAVFTNKFAAEIKRQGEADALRPSIPDPTKKREQLSRNLLAGANYLKKAEQKIGVAWKISKPFM